MAQHTQPQMPDMDPAVTKVVGELETILKIKFEARQWNPTTAMLGMSIIVGRLATAGARTLKYVRDNPPKQEVPDAEAEKAEAPDAGPAPA